jgi:DNA polymerase-3 subunit alpha
MGVEVLPPDVNDGQALFAPSQSGAGVPPAPATRVLTAPSTIAASAADELDRRDAFPTLAIRFGLAAIKGVGEVAVAGIIEARDKGGRFETLADLCSRVDSRTVNKKTLEALIKSGACDGFGETRASMFASLDRVMARASRDAADRARGQSSLFGMLEESAPKKTEKAAQLPEWPTHELLAHEKELLGFYVTGHPMTPFAPLLEKYCLHNSVTAKTLPPRTLTRLGGMISAVQQGFSKKNGKPYAMVTLEDLEGTVSMLCMNENYDKHRELLVQGKALLVVAEVNNDEDRPKLFPQEILPLEDAPKKYTKQVHLRLNTAHLTPENLAAARALCEAHRGRVPTFLCLRRPGGELIFIETHENYSVAPTQQFQQAVDDLFGEDTYYAKVDTALPERQKRAWERRAENGED